ncbi:MAG: hypothetical protein IJS58_00265 [Bacilli bacterium]|nr:hypothetical protein [Bacilli bacterium]
MKFMNDKKIRLIVTTCILTLVLIIGVITSVNFLKFRNYNTEFVVREDVVGKIYKFSEFSKHLKGDVADSNIYEIQGTDNTVAIVKKDKLANYNKIDNIKGLSVCGVDGSSQYDAAKDVFTSNINVLATANDVYENVKSGTYEVGILSYKEAITLINNDQNENVDISDAIVEKVPSLLLIGGTHPNEPSGQLAATVVLENAKVKRGILYVITELNRSAYSYSQPQEGTTWYYHLKTKNGNTRTFKYGSRATNTVDQWPTPDVYTHSSGQQLSSSEVRNINRAYPGNEEGTYTEQIAWVVTNFVNQKDVTMVIDLHEASPEYLTINQCVYHQDAADIWSQMKINGFRYYNPEADKTQKLNMPADQSPLNMHGLTHREVGDYTNAYVFLFETSNASQGKIRGAFTEDLIKYSAPDKFYEALVKYDEEHDTSNIYGAPVEISERVARHVLSFESVITGFNKIKTTRVVTQTGRDNVGDGGVYVGEMILEEGTVPSYYDLIKYGVGNYLLDID